LTEVAVVDQAPHRIPAAAYETAYLALQDALVCAFEALQDPACTSLLGAVVPGATMAFGARVPGTSYQLDPVQAACNIGTLVGWLDGGDEAFASDCGHFADNLGAILAVADYRSRKAIAEGAQPLTVGDLLVALIRAHEHASLEWTRAIRAAQVASPDRAGPSRAGATVRCGLTRIASAAAAALLLGGTETECASAVAFARRELLAMASPGAAPRVARLERWQLGDATGRGVRLALIALADRAAPLRPAEVDNEGMQSPEDLPRTQLTWVAADPIPGVANRIRDRFAAGVAKHFPTVQAARLTAMFADRARLEALPVNELVSMTIRS
jgi:2-methylcitrate dehydratase PrpD